VPADAGAHARANNDDNDGAHDDGRAYAGALHADMLLRDQRYDWRPTRRCREHVFAAERVRQRYCGRRRARQSLLLGWWNHGLASEPDLRRWSGVLVSGDVVRLRLRSGQLHHRNVDRVRRNTVQLCVPTATDDDDGATDNNHDGAAAGLDECAHTRANERADASADAVLGHVPIHQFGDSGRARLLHAAVFSIVTGKRHGGRRHLRQFLLLLQRHCGLRAHGWLVHSQQRLPVPSGVQLSLRSDDVPARHVDHHRHNDVRLHVSADAGAHERAFASADARADSRTNASADTGADADSHVWLLRDTHDGRGDERRVRQQRSILGVRVSRLLCGQHIVLRLVLRLAVHDDRRRCASVRVWLLPGRLLWSVRRQRQRGLVRHQSTLLLGLRRCARRLLFEQRHGVPESGRGHRRCWQSGAVSGRHQRAHTGADAHSADVSAHTRDACVLRFDQLWAVREQLYGVQLSLRLRHDSERAGQLLQLHAVHGARHLDSPQHV